MRLIYQRVAVLASASAVLSTFSFAPAQARWRPARREFRGVTSAFREFAPVPPSSPLYDVLVTASERGVTLGGVGTNAAALTPEALAEGLARLRRDFIHHGLDTAMPVPDVAGLPKTLTREQAVDLVMRMLALPVAQPTLDAETLSQAVPDYDSVDAPYQRAVALAAEKLLVVGTLRPTAPADRSFGAELLARAMPVSPYAASGVFADEILKALHLHLFYTSSRFPEDAPIRKAELQRAILRARVYLSPEQQQALPELHVDTSNNRRLTRGEAIALVVAGLVPDSHFGRRIASTEPVVDPDARVAFALGPDMYLSSFKDAAAIPHWEKAAVAVATYKGWLPNLPTEPGEVNADAPATMGYAANLLARSVNAPVEYTGIVLDMSDLKPIDRAGGMWVLNAGDDPTKEQRAVQVYPVSAHLPVRPFFSAPGALAYYGSVQAAEEGRAGRHPLVIKALDWAQYDWTTLHGDPGLRRGGGVAAPLDEFHFVRGTPPLILVSPADAHKMQALDHSELLLRTARIALVQPNWSLTAMRP